MLKILSSRIFREAGILFIFSSFLGVSIVRGQEPISPETIHAVGEAIAESKYFDGQINENESAAPLYITSSIGTLIQQAYPAELIDQENLVGFGDQQWKQQQNLSRIRDQQWKQQQNLSRIRDQQWKSTKVISKNNRYSFERSINMRLKGYRNRDTYSYDSINLIRRNLKIYKRLGPMAGLPKLPRSVKINLKMMGMIFKNKELNTTYSFNKFHPRFGRTKISQSLRYQAPLNQSITTRKFSTYRIQGRGGRF